MMSRRTRLLVLALVVLSGWGSMHVQDALDARRPEAGFRELIYVPSGVALKVIAFGFDAPMADALWVRGLTYFSRNLRAVQIDKSKKAKYLYIYKLLDVITDLAPRFARAYEMGGFFLTATGIPKETRRGVQLFRKGLRAYEEADAAGIPITPDNRWKLHLYAALTYDVQLPEREKAREQYEAAIRSPNCPPLIAATYEGFMRQRRAGAGALQQYDAMIGIWETALKEAKHNEDLRSYARMRLEELHEKRALLHLAAKGERILTQAVREWLAKKNLERPPASFTFQALVTDGILESLPPLSGEDPATGKPDFPILLPTGEVHSNFLARSEAEFRLDIYRGALERYVREHDRTLPGRLDQLVTEGYLDKLPEHPLDAVGYRFTYDPETGKMGIHDPRRGTRNGTE